MGKVLDYQTNKKRKLHQSQACDQIQKYHRKRPRAQTLKYHRNGKGTLKYKRDHAQKIEGLAEN